MPGKVYWVLDIKQQVKNNTMLPTCKHCLLYHRKGFGIWLNTDCMTEQIVQCYAQEMVV